MNLALKLRPARRALLHRRTPQSFFASDGGDHARDSGDYARDYAPLNAPYLRSGFDWNSDKSLVISASVLNDEIFQSPTASSALETYHSSKNLEHFTTVNLTTTLYVLRRLDKDGNTDIQFNIQRNPSSSVNTSFKALIKDTDDLLKRNMGFNYFKLRSIAELFESYR